jgi:translocation protein SEC72
MISLENTLLTSLLRRSAAYFDLTDYISALADAESVIALRKSWPKGHFRKAKALLAMGRPKEAADAVRMGLSHEPGNGVSVFLRIFLCLGCWLLVGWVMLTSWAE